VKYHISVFIFRRNYILKFCFYDLHKNDAYIFSRVCGYICLGSSSWFFTYLTWSEFFKFCSYRSTLKQLFQEFEGGNDSSQLATVTMRIMQALQINLDGKSKQYKDPALTHLFLMNNIHYIVRSVRRYIFNIYWLLISWNHSGIQHSMIQS
jgi:hypothetical protein